MKKILYYNVGAVAKIDSLRRVFEGVALRGTGISFEEVTQADFRRMLNGDVAALVLPGANVSMPYRQQLAGKNFDHMQRSIEDGLNMLAICAGAYVLSKNFEYIDYDFVTGEVKDHKKIPSEIGLVDIIAKGPDLALYPLQKAEPDNPWTAYTTAPVIFDADGKKTTTTVALSRGPGFLDTESQDVQVMARYAKTGQAAMVSFNHGKGGGVLAGPAIEVGGANLMQQVLPRYQNDPHCHDMITALESSYKEWAQLWVTLCERLLPDMPETHARIRQNFAADARASIAKNRTKIKITG